MSSENDRGPRWPLKAFQNPRFLDSKEARALRILAEFEEPRTRFNRYAVADTIVFFGSARIPSRAAAEEKLEAARAGKGNLKAAERALDMSRYYEDARMLATRFTEWSKNLKDQTRRFVVCSGGGPGIMEAANRGASEAKGVNIGLNISLPFEQHENPYITRELGFEFHYFFMRKFWFAYLAKAILIFPGGFGTLDEFFEILTLIQTGKLRKPMALVLYGKSYWEKILNLEVMAEQGTIDPADLELFLFTDSVDEAFDYVRERLEKMLPMPGATL